MLKRLLATGGLISTLLIAVVLVVLAIPRHQILALLLIGAIEFYVWWRRHDSNLDLVATTYATWLTSLSAVVLVAISPQLVMQYILVGMFVVLRLAIHMEAYNKYPGSLALTMQFVALAAIFSAAQVWRWPAALVMAFAWGASWLIARAFLTSMKDKQIGLLAGVWALVVAELSWILSWWMIAYLSPGAFLIIPQAALLVTGLAYVLGGIYRLHRTSQLSRNRLIEYLLVASALLVIILAGTRWNGAS